MKNIEYEERVLISESDYENVINWVNSLEKPLRFLNIENIYLDDGNKTIKNNGQMLRIRTINSEEQELTLKIKNYDGSHLEINETLQNHQEIDRYLNNRFQNFKEVARLNTERIEMQCDNHLFVIDKNTYHGMTDYNLEVEADNQVNAIKILKNYCEKFKIPYNSNCPSKSKRAFDRVSQTNKKDEDKS